MYYLQLLVFNILYNIGSQNETKQIFKPNYSPNAYKTAKINNKHFSHTLISKSHIHNLSHFIML